ncbi:MAG: VOC family protein [Chloroflexota bacterium]|nr:VOC family protein [Chloroflexota bacterium]
MTDTPRFTGLNLVAQDFDATLAFYRALGIDISDEKVWRTDSGRHHTEGVDIGSGAKIELDSAQLARVYNAGYRDARTAPATVIGFRAPSREAVDALHDKLTAAGYQSRQPPYDTFWGARYAIVADPDGRDVGLMSPSDPARRSAPPNL